VGQSHPLLPTHCQTPNWQRHDPDVKECEKSGRQADRQTGRKTDKFLLLCVNSRPREEEHRVKAHSKCFCLISTCFHPHTNFSTLLLPLDPNTTDVI
jgi:hypothetical protein